MFHVLLLQTFLQFHWELFITLFTARPQVNIVKFGLFGQFPVTEGTTEMFWTPSFVQSRDCVTKYHLVAHEANISKQLVIVDLAISQSLNRIH